MKKRIILYKKGFRYELALEEGKTDDCIESRNGYS